MGMTIDKTIEFFNGLESYTPQAKDARDVAVDTMRKYQKIEDIYYHQTGQALENFSLEELELLEKCLSKYCYEVSGLPTVVLSVYNKLQILKEEAENVQ